MIDMHRSTIEGTAMDISVLEALKASGDTLRQMGVTKEGLSAVDELVSSLEESMQSAADITSVLSSGSISGVVNSMAAYVVAVDEEELMRELDDMMAGPEGCEADDVPGKNDVAPASVSLGDDDGKNVAAAGRGERASVDCVADVVDVPKESTSKSAVMKQARHERKEAKKDKSEQQKEESAEMLAF